MTMFKCKINFKKIYDDMLNLEDIKIFLRP